LASANISRSVERQRLRFAAPPTIPATADKRVADLETALRKCGLRKGMVISSHHHLRDGDRVSLMALEAASLTGVKDLTWFRSASFPSQRGAIPLMEGGIIDHIEGSMNGPLGDYCTQGKMRGMGVLRSHGRCWQAIQDGEVHIDIAVIAAPAADPFGSCDGSHGKSACGSLGFALADSVYADHVIVVPDNLVPFPCLPWQIQGNNVDYVVEVDSTGDPAKIVSGSTQITRSADRLRIAEFHCTIPARCRNHAQRLLLPGRLGRNCLGVRQLSQADDEASWREGPPCAWRFDEISGRIARRGSHRLHPRRTDV
jgi:citrate lyase subunit alpha/citrate CoA-transferase